MEFNEENMPETQIFRYGILLLILC